MIPSIIKPFFWSYNTQKMDPKKSKKRIIINLLNFGTKKSTDWMFKTYKKSEILDIFLHNKKELDKKSKNYWELVLKK